MNPLILPSVGDKHAHVRLSPQTPVFCGESARYCHNLVIMPNSPAIKTGDDLVSYRRAILPHLGGCVPLMTGQLTPQTTPAIIDGIAEAGGIAMKMYTRSTTTGADHGIPREDLLNWPATLQDSLGRMEKRDMPLLIHGMMPGEPHMPYEAEREFLPVLRRLASHYPNLRIVLEHISTRWSVYAILEINRTRRVPVAATITAQHLINTINDFVYDPHMGGMLNPHLHCWPPIQTPEDKTVLGMAAVMGHDFFFLGSDSAPHEVPQKAADVPARRGCCAGVFTAPCLIETVVEEFENLGATHRLAKFVSHAGDHYYRIKPTANKIRLVREEWTVPNLVGNVVPYRAGHKLRWRAEQV